MLRLRRKHSKIFLKAHVHLDMTSLAVCKEQAAERHPAPLVQSLHCIQLVRVKGGLGFIFKDAISVKKKKKRYNWLKPLHMNMTTYSHGGTSVQKALQNATWFWPKGFFYAHCPFFSPPHGQYFPPPKLRISNASVTTMHVKLCTGLTELQWLNVLITKHSMNSP